MSDKTLSGNQIEFVNQIIDHLTEHGIVNVAALYESPYTDVNPKGPDGVFAPLQVEELVSVLETIKDRAVA